MAMATVSYNLAHQIASNDGYYADDPRVMRIVKYTNAWGKEAYGIEYEGQIGKYVASEYVIDPELYWSAG
jgi:hypothetical protein